MPLMAGARVDGDGVSLMCRPVFTGNDSVYIERNHEVFMAKEFIFVKHGLFVKVGWGLSLSILHIHITHVSYVYISIYTYLYTYNMSLYFVYIYFFIYT